MVAAPRIVWNRVNSVLVLIPPPVDPGDAPININTVTVRSPALVKFPRENVENPAVLAETLVKNAPSQVICSVMRINTVPTTSRMALVVIHRFGVQAQPFKGALAHNIHNHQKAQTRQR